MAVITINGQRGSGAREIGTEVARILGYEYFDRLILAQSAELLGATVAAVEDKWQRRPGFGERLTRLFERFGSASAGDAYIGTGLGELLRQDYPEAVKEAITRADRLVDDQFLRATRDVILALADATNVVIIGRASNHILKDRPDAFHVGLISTMEARIEVIKVREGMSSNEAEKFIKETEAARIQYFRKFFDAVADDFRDFHIMLNTGLVQQRQAADIIVSAVSRPETKS